MKTLVTGALGATDAELDMLHAAGLEITLHPDERKPVEHPEQFEAVICNGLFLYHDIQAFSNLRYIQLTSAGLDRVPVAYIQSHGIELHNAAGVYSVPMAEWTIMRILELYKNAARLYENQAPLGERPFLAGAIRQDCLYRRLWCLWRRNGKAAESF